MEITNLPIVDYLKFCKTISEKRGFLWVMVLLARERDSQKSYEDLRKYWNSYDDLTHNKILFLLSTSEQHEPFYERGFNLETCEAIRVNNCNFSFINQNPPSFSEDEYRFSQILKRYRNKAIKNNTNYISEICEAFDIKESCVPSILLFPLDSLFKQSIITIPICNDDLYATIKQFIDVVNQPIRELRKHDDELKKINEAINKMKCSPFVGQCGIIKIYQIKV